MADILSLATAALRPGQLDDKDNKRFPRVDYIELKRYHDVKILDYDFYHRSRLGDFISQLETKMRSDVYLALLGFRQRKSHRLVFAWSERAGIPYAGLRRLYSTSPPFAAMFTCWSPRQEKTILRLDLFSYMDTIAVHCQSMKQHFESLGVPAGKVHRIPYSVDERFFSPRQDIEQVPGLVLSLGEVRSRDYRSLFEAVEDMPLRLLVAASGSWYAREKQNAEDFKVPENTTLSGGFDLQELRDLYSQSQFVVLPLYDEIYSAGATSSLEAMAMSRAVVAFRSRGIVDYVRDGETGILVEPGSVQEMRRAIEHLLAHPEEARRLGENGRHWVEEELNLDQYVSRIAAWLDSCLSESRGR